MFNNKKKEIAKLYSELRAVDEKISQLHIEAKDREEYIKTLEESIEKLTECNNNVPKGCKEGEWCQACEFVRHYKVPRRNYCGYEEYYFCGKKEVCKNFVERKDRNSD